MSSQPEPNLRPSVVFLSHSSADKPFVRFLADELRSYEVPLWLDELELEVGDLLTARIGSALERSSHVIACLTPRSIASRWVTREIAMADSLRIGGQQLAVIPLLYGDLRDEQLPDTLRDRVYADCRSARSYDQALRAIVSALTRPAEAADLHDRMSGTASQPMQFDAQRAQRFIVAATNAPLRAWLVDYLAALLETSWDHASRHFAYQTLGSIGGPAAAVYVRRGLEDPNDWARQGAVAAAARLQLGH
jgi:hypothetical protein